ACADKVNPSTGTSDCPQDQYLCNDPNYKTLMQQQCPKTCGYFENRLLKMICKLIILMTVAGFALGQNCLSIQGGCILGQCPGGGQCIANVCCACADKVNPATGTSDCPQDKYLCNDPNYKTLMQQQCPKTCGFC
ncbi:hypothetical protein FO519_008201, partial [Halicephalobus sp. NKZ332]